MLPYFKKAQTHSDGGDDYRGHDGPLHVTRFPGEGELDQAWLKAGQQAGQLKLLLKNSTIHIISEKENSLIWGLLISFKNFVVHKTFYVSILPSKY